MNKHVSTTVIPGDEAVHSSDAEPFDMARLCGRLCLVVAPRCGTVCAELWLLGLALGRQNPLLLDPENELRSTGYAFDDLIGENRTEPL